MITTKNKIRLAYGFTLIELMVAISILSIAIIATYTAVSNNLRGSNFAEDQVVAYYLADEAVEYIINVRDTNAILNQQSVASGGSSVSWLNGIAGVPSDPCFGTTCKVNAHAKTLQTCGGICPMLTIDSNGFYGEGGSTQTVFKRTITVVSLSGSEALITSTVSWTTGGVAKNYTLTEIIRNWQ